MKTFVALLLMTLVQLNSIKTEAYILPLEIILQKSAQLAGHSIIGVEQEVQFKDGLKTYSIKESWLVEGDRNLKLTATGMGDLKEAIKVSSIYNTKNRTSLLAQNKIASPYGSDFFEKYLAIKSKDSFENYLKELNVAPQVRLSRAGGLICFAVGTESTTDNLNSQVWIDQNSFRLVKMRLPSNAEIEFLDYIVKDGIHYPLKKIINWDGKTVTIIVKKLTTKANATIKNFYPETLDTSSQISLGKYGVAGAVFEDFYTRFR